jgi:Holliday junction DNA helicase RuvA
MIAKLTGTLDDFGPDWAVIDVSGVGYLVQCSARTLGALGARGDLVVLHTEMQVSDSDVRLIGFSSAGERAWFKLLTGVQGVGAKMALAVLSALSVVELQRACAGGDAAMVTRANGVGAKLAARIVNELKDKAGALGFGGAGPGAVLAGAIGGAGVVPGASPAADAASALENLGFKPMVAAQAVSVALGELGEDADVGALIRLALKRVA